MGAGPETHDAATAPQSASAPTLPRTRFFRGRRWVFIVLSLPFFLGLAGALTLVALYHWPSVHPVAFYFTARPAVPWFFALTPLLVFGLPALRTRWFLCGCAIWLLALAACEDIAPLARPFAGSRRQRFESLRMGFRSHLNSGGQVQEGDRLPLRIVTWNVRAGTMGAQQALAQVASLDPDIIFFQEYEWAGPDDMGRTVGKTDWLKGYHIGRAGRGAVASRFPLSRLPNEGLSANLAAVWVADVTERTSVTCINAHLPPQDLRTQFRHVSWQRLAHEARRRRLYLDRLRELVDRYSNRGPIILAGDFNVPAHYPDLRRATKGLTDAFQERGSGWGATAPANHRRIPFPVARIDLVFLSEEADVRHAAAIPTKFSDHYMTLVEALLPARLSRDSAPRK